MKKILILAFSLVLVLSFGACGKETHSDSNIKSEVQESQNDGSADTEHNTLSGQSAENDGSKIDSEIKEESVEDITPITLTAGEIVLNGYLNGSEPAKSLLDQLPITVTLNDSDNDFCGGSLDITYDETDVQNGYQNGDLAFWTPADNFVIFVDDEENSQDTGDLVMLGKITDPQETLDALEGTLDITIALADEANTAEKEIPSGKNEESEESDVKVKITVGDTELTASMEDNATTRAILEQMPMTLPMMDLYGREMCYRYGAYALPTDHLQSDGYEVGDIAYWAPGGSLVILYEQNGEQFERQHLGHIDSGVEVFQNTGDVDVKFEVMEEP